MVKKLHIVASDPGATSAIPAYPRPLSDSGQALWMRIQSEYTVTDSGGIELLLLACEATDRLAEIAAAISRDGVVCRTKAGPRVHPLLREETQIRALVSRLIGKMGIDSEPVRAMGRPPLGM